VERRGVERGEAPPLSLSAARSALLTGCPVSADCSAEELAQTAQSALTALRGRVSRWDGDFGVLFHPFSERVS